nr:MAG TPA: hypothetical protein [Caudoviricetes sp.]
MFTRNSWLIWSSDWRTYCHRLSNRMRTACASSAAIRR